MPNQPERLTTFGDILLLEAHQSFPEELAYELVRTMVENYEQISQYNALTRVWDGATLAYTADTNPELFHPGALKAYRDLGLVE